MTDEWHVSVDVAQRGPLSPEHVRSLVSSGQSKPTDHVWKSWVFDRLLYKNECSIGIVRLAIAYVALLLVSSQAKAQFDLPLKFQMDLRAAESSFFGGELDKAVKCIVDARGWVKEPKNKKILAEQGFDWSIVECLAMSLHAQILCEIGSLKQAKQMLETVDMRLEKKRKPGQRNEAFLWLNDAFLDVTRGDVWYQQAYPLVDTTGLPKDLVKHFQGSKARLGKAEVYYGKALVIAEKVFKGAPVTHDPVRRLLARIKAGLGRMHLTAGRPLEQQDGDLNELDKAKEFFKLADQDFRSTQSFKMLLAPHAKVPLTLQQMKQAFQEQKIAPDIAHEIESMYARIVVDCVRLNCDQAELAVSMAAMNPQPDSQHLEAEAFYQKAKDTCRTNLGQSHPVNYRIKISQANYYLTRAIESRRLAGAAGDDAVLRRRYQEAAKSFCLDAAFLAESVLREVKVKLVETHPIRLEALLLEWRAFDAGAAMGDRKKQDIVDETRNVLESQEK
jgi:hypothetical protein